MLPFVGIFLYDGVMEHMFSTLNRWWKGEKRRGEKGGRGGEKKKTTLPMSPCFGLLKNQDVSYHAQLAKFQKVVLNAQILFNVPEPCLFEKIDYLVCFCFRAFRVYISYRVLESQVDGTTLVHNFNDPADSSGSKNPDELSIVKSTYS